MNKKLILLLVCLNLCLFLPYNISAFETSNFLSRMWLNGNGYYFNKRSDYLNTDIKLKYADVWGTKFPLYGETNTSGGACYFDYNKGDSYITGSLTNSAETCNNLTKTHFIYAFKYNTSWSYTLSLNSDNRENAINQLKYLNWKYTLNGPEESATKVTYSSPLLWEGFFDNTSSDSETSYNHIYSMTDSGITYKYLKSRISNVIFAYRLIYKLDSSGDVQAIISNNHNYSNDSSYPEGVWIDSYGRVYGYIGQYSISSNSYGIRMYGGQSGRWPTTTKPELKLDLRGDLNNTEYGLTFFGLIGIIPTPDFTETETFKYIASLKYGSDYLNKLNTYSNGSINLGVSYFYLDYNLGMISDVINNKQTPLPLTYAELIYNNKTYFNNRNNSYWITTGQIDSGGGSGEGGSGGSGDGGSGGGSGGSGGGSGSGDGSGGDTTITIDTKNIENLLQQILEILQNQGTTDVDLTEIENLLNAIKNNLKDYTGDLTTINNTLILINQFLNNNIDVPISDLKTLLNDIKTLSEYQKEQLTGISSVLHDMKQLFIDIYNRLGEIKDKIGSTINNIEEGTNLWDVLKALIDNLGNFLSSGLELFEKLLVPQGTFQTDFNSTITGIQDKLGVLYQPVDVFSNFLTNLYTPSKTSSLAEAGHVIKIPEAKYDGVTIIESQSIDLDETVEKSGLKPLYDVYLLIVDMIVLFGILNLAFKKFHDIISENGGDYK